MTINDEECKTFKKPKGVEETSDLALRMKNDDFWICRILKWLILALAVVMICFFTFIFIIQICLSQELLFELTHKIIDNIGVIFISAFSILGVKHLANN